MSVPTFAQFWYFSTHPELETFKNDHLLPPLIPDNDLNCDIEAIYKFLIEGQADVRIFEVFASHIRNIIQVDTLNYRDPNLTKIVGFARKWYQNRRDYEASLTPLLSSSVQLDSKDSCQPNQRIPSPSFRSAKPKAKKSRRSYGVKRRSRRSCQKVESDRFVVLYPRGGKWLTTSELAASESSYDVAKLKSFKCPPSREMSEWFGTRTNQVLLKMLAPDLLQAAITKTNPEINTTVNNVPMNLKINFLEILSKLDNRKYRVEVSTRPGDAFFCPESHIYQLIFYLIFSCVVSGRDRNVMLRTLLSLVRPIEDYDRIVEAVLSYARPTMLASLATHRNLVGPLLAQELVAQNYTGSLNALMRAKIYPSSIELNLKA